jgi:hypothetical protein
MEKFLNHKVTRGVIGVIGFGIAGCSFSIVAAGIADSIGGNPEQDLAGILLATVCMLTSGLFGSGMCWFGYRGIFGEPEPAVDPEDQVLEVAKQNDGRVTAAEMAANSDLSLREADETLTGLAEQGLARMDVDNEGNNVFVFAGVGDSETQSAEQRFESELADERGDDSTDAREDEPADERQSW